MTLNLASPDIVECNHRRGCLAFYDGGRHEAAALGWQTNQMSLFPGGRRLDFCPEHRLTPVRKVFRPVAGVDGWVPLHDYVRDSLGGDYDRYHDLRRARKITMRRDARGAFMVKEAKV